MTSYFEYDAFEHGHEGVTGVVAGTIRAVINPKKLIVGIDQGHKDNGEEALVLSIQKTSSPRTCCHHMLVI